MGYDTKSQKMDTSKNVEGLSEKKIVDVACGDRFTVVLACEISERLPKIFPKANFNEKNLANIKDRNQTIMEVLNIRKKLRNEDINCEELLENMSKDEINLEQKIIKSQTSSAQKIKKSSSSQIKKHSNSLHVSSNRNFMETSQNLLNEISLSRIHKDIPTIKKLDLMKLNPEISKDTGKNCYLNNI